MKNKLDDLDLITTADLNAEPARGKELYHFIYASQLYGTFFGIYANFAGDKTASGDYQINKITLRLVNYKGAVNIGFTDDYPELDPLGLTIYFRVIGASSY